MTAAAAPSPQMMASRRSFTPPCTISHGATPAPHEHNDQPRDTASLNEDIPAIEASRDDEIQRFREAEGWTQRCEALVAQHKEMLRIAEGYTAEREGWRRGEVERYRQIEDIANEFLKSTGRQSHRITEQR
ncbi:hypothetical protein LSM04_007452 [Trypanosoma melophagium]|uniref:uncharacterized protein n=1 Tax=Trypanosoma melophagium TaxID=715481 RepID=UPI00351A396F|nr:hypothetical protein LSM04_007452 [Trypanosoma melophagium]